MSDGYEKRVTYGQAIKLAAATYDIEAFATDDEFIETVLLRADVFYPKMMKRFALLEPSPPVALAQQAAVRAAEARPVANEPPPSIDFDTPFGEEPAAPPAPTGAAMASSGLGHHSGERWKTTEIRCQGCGLYTLVENLDPTAKVKYECSSRHRTKNPNTGDWETVSACNYVSWRS